MWTFYIIVMLCVLTAVSLLVKHYTAPTVSIIVLVVVGLSWTTALSVVALVPIDVWTTLSQRSPYSLDVLWSISYWTTQFLTWLIIPIMQGWCDAGDFTAFGRLKSSVRDNVRFWLIMASLGVVGLFILFVTNNLTLDFAEVKKIVMTLSNTYGLIACMFLLGYGLVEIPRTVWRRSFPESRLKWHFYRVGKAAERLEDTAFEMQRVITVVHATSGPISRRDPLRANMDVILKYVEDYSPLASEATANVDIEQLSDADLDYGLDIKGLAQLRRRVVRGINSYTSAKVEYENYVRRAFELDAICNARASHDYAHPEGRTSKLKQWNWQYKCLVKPWVQRLTAVGLALFSGAVVWSEATIKAERSPDLSPFSIAVHNVTYGELITQVLVALPLSYICLCAYYSLFKLGMFRFYHLVVHCTSGPSLLLSGSLLCRFAAPLCFNFLHVIRMDKPEGEPTVFVKKMGGAMNDVNLPFTGQEFNRWFPLTMVVYTAMLVFEIWDNALTRACARVGRMFIPEKADQEHVERGKQLLRAEQEAVLRGQALGEVLGLFGVQTSSHTRSNSVQLTGSRKSSSARVSTTTSPVGSSRGLRMMGIAQGRDVSPPSPTHSGAQQLASSSLWPPWRKSSGTSAASGASQDSGKGGAAGPKAGIEIAAGMSALKNVLLRNKFGGASNPDMVPLIHRDAGSKTGGLDDIFARMDGGGGGGTGRIDDDDGFL